MSLKDVFTSLKQHASPTALALGAAVAVGATFNAGAADFSKCNGMEPKTKAACMLAEVRASNAMYAQQSQRLGEQSQRLGEQSQRLGEQSQRLGTEIEAHHHSMDNRQERIDELSEGIERDEQRAQELRREIRDLKLREAQLSMVDGPR